jgi:hypothetical protein
VREIFSHPDVTRVGYCKSLLDEAGIPCFVQNENTIGAVGAAFPPSLCITNDSDYDEAVRLLKSRQFAPAADDADWTCPACSEKNPGNFELCWNCNAPRQSS